VFFRSSDLPAAFSYLGSMFGLGGGPGAAAPLLGALVYRPYYLLSFGAAAVIAFAAPQTWDWTRRLPLWKAAACMALLWLSLVMMTSQAYNPFIYFIF
jgi:alginate O-acetyltransferase complex protein AlgI